MVSTRNFSVKCFTGHCKKKQRQRSILKLGRGGGGWRGAYLHLAMHIPVLKFSKIPLAIFTVSSLSVQTGRGLKKEKMAKRVRGGGGNYLRDSYYSRKYGTCLDGEQEIGL